MAEGPARQVRVTYKRSVSDGNYGTEGAEVTLEYWIEEPEASMSDDVEAADDLLNTAHGIVNNRLRQSLNPTVRRAIQVRTTAPPSTAATVPDDDDERLPF